MSRVQGHPNAPLLAFYNVTFRLMVTYCSNNTSVKPTQQENSNDYSEDDDMYSPFARNIQKTVAVLVSKLKHFFYVGDYVEPDSRDTQMLNICDTEVLHDFSFTFYPTSVIDWCSFLIISVLVLISIVYSIRCLKLFLLQRQIWSNLNIVFWKRLYNSTPLRKRAVVIESVAYQGEHCNSSGQTSESQSAEHLIISDCQVPNEIHHTAGYIPNLPGGITRPETATRSLVKFHRIDTGKFLSQTLRLLSAGLDRVLWTKSSSILVTASSSLHRTNSLPRRRSTPMFQRQDDDVSDSDSRSWEEFEILHQTFDWNISWTPRLERRYAISHHDSTPLQQLTRFYESKASINMKQWHASSWFASYVLLLLDKELKSKLGLSGSSNSFSFVEFIPIGSAKKGLRAKPCNEFDALMVLQPVDNSVSEVLSSQQYDTIPNASVLLKMANPWFGSARRFIKDLKLGNEDRAKPCLSCHQFAILASSLLDQSIDEIVRHGNSFQDWMPFRMTKSSKEHFRIAIDTKGARKSGFECDEISITLYPAICFDDGGMQQMALYATPYWVFTGSERSKTQPKFLHNQNENSRQGEKECVWTVSTGKVEDAYLKLIDGRMKMSNIESCHVLCTVIVNCLVKDLREDGLVDRDSASCFEISGHHVETVMNYLLLESSPGKWTFDKLADRVSDCVIFLRSALTYMRLPRFFAHNPHLFRHFPQFQKMPGFSSGRQENLFSGMTEERSKELLERLDSALARSNIEGAIKKEYSPEMWEYEFFVFS